jgi:hypothetical protein
MRNAKAQLANVYCNAAKPQASAAITNNTTRARACADRADAG